MSRPIEDKKGTLQGDIAQPLTSDDQSVSTIDDVCTLPPGTFDPVYEAKARVLNRAILDIGMGWYQWQLFIVIGFGWAADNLWPITTSIIFPAVAKEFLPVHPEYLTLAQNIGLLVGAAFWGFGCDIFGRKWGFNLTLGITSVFGMIAAGSPTFAAVCVFAALWSFGVGGNLPVDSAIFLEFLPGTHQYLLTILSVDWALAQVFTTLVAWPLLGNARFMCQTTEETCTRSKNMGWRYFIVTMGGVALVMFGIRFLAFTILESPKYLMGKGRDEEAVQVVHEVARRNGKTSTLTFDDLRACEPSGYQAPVATADLFRRSLEEVNMDRIKGLFGTPRLALSTSLIILVWALLGLGFPLYNAFLPALQGNKFPESSTYEIYRNTLIIAVLGVPGALIGGWLVELKGFGRRVTLGLATTLTGVFLFVSTTAQTPSALLGYNCAYSFFSTTMYAVLYAYTPEVFPTSHRGTGNALTACSSRIFGVMAPLIRMFADRTTSIPVYISGALFVVAGIICFVLPYESRGKAAL